MYENYIFDESVSFNEEFDKYIEENYIDPYPLLTGFENYQTEVKHASTLDEYLMLLVKGYINVELNSDLDKYLMELLENEWFYQWPLIHWSYASRLLYGIGCRKSVKRAIEMLFPMAEEGCPGALYDIGCCYQNGLRLTQSYPRALYNWIKASRGGYLKAQQELRSQYWSRNYHKNKDCLPAEIRYDFMCEIKKIFLESRNVNEDNAEWKLDKEDLEEYQKICREINRQKKQHLKSERMQEIGEFFWGEDANPYKPNF